MPYEQAREACNRLLVEQDEKIRNYIIDMLGGDESEEEMKDVVTAFLLSTEHCAEDAAMVKVTELFASLSAATPAHPAKLKAGPRIRYYNMSLWRLRHAVPRHATLSTLSGDELGIILGQLRNTLEPWHVMYFSSASKKLRALLPPAARQQLRADYQKATGLEPHQNVVRNQNIILGYVNDENRPLDVDTDEEADARIRTRIANNEAIGMEMVQFRGANGVLWQRTEEDGWCAIYPEDQEGSNLPRLSARARRRVQLIEHHLGSLTLSEADHSMAESAA